MFVDFFHALRQGGVPVSVREYLTLLETLQAGLPQQQTLENFYYLARTCWVKDERNFDKFDRVFSSVFKGIESQDNTLVKEIPEEWLKKLTENMLSEEEKKQIEALGGFEKLMETLKKRMEEQKKTPRGRQ